MRLLGICGSNREGNNELALKILLEAAEENGVETELVTLRDKRISTCTGKCHEICHFHDENGNLLPGGWFRCTRKDDGAEILDKMVKADGIVLATPVLFGGLSAVLKILMERSNALTSFDKEEDFSFLAGKYGGAIAIGGARHAGQELALSGIMNYYLVMQMLPVGLGEFQAPLGLALMADGSGKILEDHWKDYEVKDANAIKYLKAYGRKMAKMIQRQ